MTSSRKCVFGDKAKNTFLEELSRTGLLAKSARAVGTNSRRIRSECDLNKEFEYEMQEALLLYAEKVQAELARRAIEGVKEVVYFQGQKCGTKTVYSDSLLTQLVKAKSPEFREKISVDTTIHGGVLLTLPTAQTQNEWLEAANEPSQLPAHENNSNDIIDIEPAETDRDITHSEVADQSKTTE